MREALRPPAWRDIPRRRRVWLAVAAAIVLAAAVVYLQFPGAWQTGISAVVAATGFVMILRVIFRRD